MGVWVVYMEWRPSSESVGCEQVIRFKICIIEHGKEILILEC